MKKEGIMKINDFSISFSTVNGSGSATANTTIQKSIFYMGIPVAGRNIFPSNIQGMPTWFDLRISKDNFLGTEEKSDILISMNPATVNQDLKDVKENGLVLLDNRIEIEAETGKNLQIFTMPVSEIMAECQVPTHLEVYLANMVYVGVLAAVIDIDLSGIERALAVHFNGSRKAIDPNMNVVNQSYFWALSNIKETRRFKLEPLNLNDGKIMIDGNTAAALGALFGGLQFSSWYPITPATSLAESLNDFIPKLRTDPQTGKSTCAVVQAEDELAAIGMVAGAGWAGLRAMTSTSGPGLCLMAEFLGLAYFVEIPLVVWDVQRVGPSTGLPTRTSQGDLSFSYFLSHGDKNFVILLPADMNECFDFGWQALDIAEQLQTPVIVLGDLELGMNIWMADAFEYPDKEIDRGKILWEDDLEKVMSQNNNVWGRYLDLDGDGVAYRTLPGNQHPNAPYFARGTGHNEFSRYSENPTDWENNLLRLKKKIMERPDLVPAPKISLNESASHYGVITYGSSSMPVEEAIHILKGSQIDVDLLRVRGMPFNEMVKNFIADHKKIFIVENNRDGQMMQILCINYPDHAQKFISIARCNGLSLPADWVSEEIRKRIVEV